MRATLFLWLSYLFLGLFLWVTLSGAALVLSGVFYLILLIIGLGYPDTAILFFLGAREVRSGDETPFFEAAAQEAYKLAITQPKIYIYNGTLDRAFILEDRHKLSLVLSRSLLGQLQPQELSAICFGLLLQVKKGLASKRTKVMFLLGAQSWLVHSFFGVVARLMPFKEVRIALGWLVNYLLHPWLNFFFHLVLGEGYFKRVHQQLKDFPAEKEMVERLGLKIRKAEEIYSIPSRKVIELHSSSRSRHFQNILALELLPHEWDIILQDQELNAQKA